MQLADQVLRTGCSISSQACIVIPTRHFQTMHYVHTFKGGMYIHIATHTFCRACAHQTIVYRVVEDSGYCFLHTAHCKRYLRLPNMTAPYAHKGI